MILLRFWVLLFFGFSYCSSVQVMIRHLNKFTIFPLSLVLSLCSSRNFWSIYALFSLSLYFLVCFYYLFIQFASFSFNFACHCLSSFYFSFPYFRSFKLCSFRCHVRWHICFIRFIIICLLDAFAASMCCCLSVLFFYVTAI